jgi:hypothetical protein
MATATRAFHFPEMRKGQTLSESTTIRVNAMKIRRQLWLRAHIEELAAAALCLLGLMWAAQSMSSIMTIDAPMLPPRALEVLVGGIGLYLHARYRKFAGR